MQRRRLLQHCSLSHSMSCRRTYETVSGYFIQDTADPEPVNLPYPRLGLIDVSPERWTRFMESIVNLNLKAPTHVQYKVIFLIRHGQGVHNVAMEKYERKEWDNHLNRLNGDGELIWGPDPELTGVGVQQARAARMAWAAELSMDLPFPGKSYCSPLTRAIQTCEIIFGDLKPPGHHTTIIENVREKFGLDTCDKRRSRSYIQRRFHTFRIEESLTEEDELWTQDIKEERFDVELRAAGVLDMIFDYDAEQIISIVSHGEFISAFLRVVKHSPCHLPTGGVIPVVVKGMVADSA